MVIQEISGLAYSVYISERELNEKHLTPSAVTAADAMELVSAITPPDRSAGRCTTQLELYPGRHELLIFVRRGPEKLRVMSFRSIEDVISAVTDGGAADPSSLFYYDNRYILVMWLRNGEAVCEFGDEMPVTAAFLPHLYEHGRTLCDGCAVGTLKGAFRQD